MAHLRKRQDSPYFWVQYYDPATGKKRAFSTKTKNRKVAQHIKADFEQKLLRGHEGRDAGLVSSLMAEYLEALKPHKTQATHYNDELKAKKINERIGGIKIEKLAARTIEKMLADMQREYAWSATTRNHYLKLLRSFCRWSVSRGLLFSDPTERLKNIKPVHRPRVWMNKAQRDKFLDLARGDFYFPMVATACFAGLRWRELVTLEWQDVDFKQDTLTVRPKDDFTPKSKRARVIPLHPELKTILAPLRKKAGHCFPTPRSSRGFGHPYKTDASTEKVTDWLKAVGLSGKGLGWHSLRHTFAANAVQAGVSIYKVSNWLGHADVRTTAIYAHLAPEFDAEIGKI